MAPDEWTPRNDYTSDLFHCGSFYESPNCCDSCHQDDEAGYFGLNEVEDGRTVIGLVCCSVKRALIEDGILPWDA